MGTRHLICVVHEQKYKVAQYGQFDGDPNGKGTDILNFLKSKEFNKKRFAKKLDYCFFIGVDYVETIYFGKYGYDLAKNDNVVPPSLARQFIEDHPSLNRRASAKVLNYINDIDTSKERTQLPLQDDLQFAGDSLMCEWCYVIDLDKNTFEVYKGFNKEELSEFERFFFLQKEDSKYKPVTCIASYDLNKLPDDLTFIKDCDNWYEDEQNDMEEIILKDPTYGSW